MNYMVIARLVALEFWYRFSCHMHLKMSKWVPLTRGEWLMHTAFNQVDGPNITPKFNAPASQEHHT